MPKGTIKRLMDRGFGFIKTEEQEGDLFFHRSDIEGVEFASLREGQEVEFEMGQGRDGRQQAVKVSLAETQVEDASDDSGDDDGNGGDDGGNSGN
jgi:CspA family cold shock protein